MWAHDLLDRYGQGAIVLGTDRLATALLSRLEARGIYAVVDVAGPLFDGVALPTSIAFFVHQENLKDPEAFEGPLRISARREDLDDGETARVVSRARDEAVSLVTRHPRGRDGNRPGIDDLREAFDAVARKNELRRKADEEDASGRFDLDLRGKRVRARLSPFA